MRFPTYKVHALVRVFNVRSLRSEIIETATKALTTWGRNAAYNSSRYERISKLPIRAQTVSPWRHTVLHEIVYFNNRYEVYIGRWRKCYEQCMLTLERPLAEHISIFASLWQIAAFNEASRLNINYRRNIRDAKGLILKDWESTYKLNHHLLKQVLPPSSREKTAWDLAHVAILRSSFRNRRFEWQSYDMFRDRK